MMTKNDFHEEEGALRLAAGILEQAARDYINAILDKNKNRMMALERFFFSSWGQELSMCQGEIIVEWCRRIASEKNKHRRRKRDRMKRKK